MNDIRLGLYDRVKKMMYIRGMLSKRKLSDSELIKAAIEELNIKAHNVLIVNEINDWLKKNDEVIVFEYNGFIDEEEEEYYGYHYYDIFIYQEVFLDRLKAMVNRIDTEVVFIN